MIRTLCLLVLIGVFVNGEESNPLAFSRHLREIAKQVNESPDALWVAHDPDMSDEEFEARRMVVENRIVEMSKTSPRNHAFDVLDRTHPGFVEQANLLSSVDWSTSPYMRPVENQGQCGSCWAFSTVHAFNDFKNIVSNGADKTSLSIQEILTCCTGQGCGGCNGGYLVASYNYMARYGTPSSQCKGYNQYPGRCSSTCDDRSPANSAYHWFSTGYHAVNSPGINTMMTALQTGPASGSLFVYEDLMTYRSGIYHHMRGSQQGGHAIEIVGYGGTGSSSYWLVKNSWGTSWGASGFFKMIMGTNDCNFESMERGYNTAPGFRKQVVNPPQPFRVLDTTDQPVGDGEPAGDEPEPAPTNDMLVLEAASFAASQLNPTHCDGNVTLWSVLEAETQIVSGAKFFMSISVNAAPGFKCERGPEAFFVQVYMGIDGSYELQNSYAMGPLPKAEHTVDAVWRSVAGAFIGFTVVLSIVAFALCSKLRSPRGPAPDSTAGYHNLNSE